MHCKSLNCTSLLISIAVAFATIWITDLLIHGVWLAPTYGATKELWRPEDEMMRKMPWMFAGQAVVATAFTLIYACFVADKRSLQSSLVFGACVALMVAGGQLIMYCVQPYPGHLVAKWCWAALVQMMLLGAILTFVYRPLKT